MFCRRVTNTSDGDECTQLVQPGQMLASFWLCLTAEKQKWQENKELAKLEWVVVYALQACESRYVSCAELDIMHMDISEAKKERERESREKKASVFYT